MTDSRLQDYLRQPIEPGQKAFLAWLVGVSAWGQRTCVMAGVAMARLVLNDLEVDDSATAPICTAIEAAEAWIADPCRQHREECRKAAEAAADAASVARERLDGVAKSANLIYDKYGDCVGGVFRDGMSERRFDEAGSYLRGVQVARWTAQTAAVKTLRECKAVLRLAAEATLESVLTSTDLRKAVLDTLTE